MATASRQAAATRHTAFKMRPGRVFSRVQAPIAKNVIGMNRSRCEI